MIERVTITGADHFVSPKDLLEISQKFPFVEWALLLSKRDATNRFPTENWINEFVQIGKENNLKIAGHICGSWIRDLAIKGKETVFLERPEFINHFSRIQFNFSCYSPIDFSNLLTKYIQKNIQFIFQVGNFEVENKIALFCDFINQGLNMGILADRSGGKGIPDEIPSLIINPSESTVFASGYAGGLSPDNLSEQLEKLFSKTSADIWIDMESNVRTHNFLDLNKVVKCLEITKPWIKNV